MYTHENWYYVVSFLQLKQIECHCAMANKYESQSCFVVSHDCNMWKSPIR